MEDILKSQEATKAGRETFLQDGAEELNKLSSKSQGLKIYGSAYSDLVPNGSLALVNERWRIDPSADDIYGEIDRALASTHKAMSIYEDIGTRVSAELKRRGIHESEVEFPTRSAFENMEHWSPFQDIYEKIRRQFWKSI